MREIVMYATSWCGDCALARRFLKARNLPFRERDVDEEAEAEAVILSHNGGSRLLPVFEFDGRRLTLAPFDRLKLSVWLREVGAPGGAPISGASPSDPQS
jgi:mycoredoxin